MNLARFLGLAAMLSLLAACNSSLFGGGPDCGSDATQQAIDQLLKEELEFAVQSELASLKDKPAYNATQLENAIDRIKVRLEDVRSSPDGAGGSRLSCRATLLIALPKTVEGSTNEARAMAEMGTVRELAGRYKIKRRSGSFASDFAYSVQPTDDGEKLVTEFDSEEPALEFLGEVITSYALVDEIRARKVKADRIEADQKRAQREIDQALVAEAEAKLKSAKVERELASEAIRGVWDAMPDAAKRAIDKPHEVWIGQMQAKCAADAVGSDNRAAMREANKLDCESRNVRSCARVLRGNTIFSSQWTYCPPVE